MIEIVRAKPAEAEALSAIAFSAKRVWGYPEAWIDAWCHVLTITPEFIANEETFCVMEGETAVGFYALIREHERLRLEHLWVLPRAMQRGLGRALFEHAVARARALGFGGFEIEGDPNAEPFYLRMGARRVGSVLSEVCGERRELPTLRFGSV